MKKQTRTNLLLQTIYQIINTCLPLLTSPYLSRVLGASQLGVFSFSSSVVSYFTLVAMLGTINYGTRLIASCRDDAQRTRESFWDLYYLQLVCSLLCLGAYAIYLAFFCKDNLAIFAIQSIAIASCLLDITWFFFGIERFKITVSRSFLVKLITVTLIFVFVKDSQDLWIYTLIMVSGTALSFFLLFFSLPRHFRPVRPSISRSFVHLKGSLLLFVPLLAMSVYHSMDKTMLGILADYEQSGLYYNADKIINIPVAVLVGIGAVMLPHVTSLYAKNKKEEAGLLFGKSFEIVSLGGIAMAFGISAISKEFVPLFFGDGFEGCVLLIQVLSPVLLIKGISDTLRTQYLIPLHKERIYIIAVVIGAIVNLVLNLLLIPKYGALGAVIGTLAAEFIAMLVQLLFIVRKISFRRHFIGILFYMVAGVAMFFVVRWSSMVNVIDWVKVIVEVAVGGFTFLVLVFVYSLLVPSSAPGTLLLEFRHRKIAKQPNDVDSKKE